MRDNYLISVIITNFNTLDFVELSLYALKNLTKNRYKVLINDNGSSQEEISRLKKIGESNENIFVNFRKSDKDAAYAHAEALDILIDMADTQYTAVLDSDCVFLLKDWDDILIGMLDEKVKIVGSPLAKGRNGLKPYDFPLQFAVLFETQTYKKLNISCIPGDVSKGEDTCWEWKPKFLNSGYGSKVFLAKNTRDFQDGQFRNIVGVEDYFIDDGRLIASHFGRGSSGGMGKRYQQWFLNIPRASKFIRKYAARNQRKEWMSICNNIINSQKIS